MNVFFSCRRPSTASRPSSSSSSARPGSASSSRSSESQKPKISVPNVSSDRLLSDRSATDRVDSVSVASVSNVQLVLSSGDGQQVAGQRKGHSRKPSDGAKQMEPIHEDKGRGERMQSSSESTVTTQDTVVAVTVVSKEVGHTCTHPGVYINTESSNQHACFHKLENCAGPLFHVMLPNKCQILTY